MNIRKETNSNNQQQSYNNNNNIKADGCNTIK